MPDVVGMGLKDALYLLENEGLQVEVVGVGKIKEQSIPAGAALSKGLKVTIKLG
jgi:cell division protein FtsI (penicillin-binding protein 3)